MGNRNRHHPAGVRPYEIAHYRARARQTHNVHVHQVAGDYIPVLRQRATYHRSRRRTAEARGKQTVANRLGAGHVGPDEVSFVDRRLGVLEDQNAPGIKHSASLVVPRDEVAVACAAPAGRRSV